MRDGDDNRFLDSRSHPARIFRQEGNFFFTSGDRRWRGDPGSSCSIPRWETTPAT